MLGVLEGLSGGVDGHVCSLHLVTLLGFLFHALAVCPG
jgi:hypothetical protein